MSLLFMDSFDNYATADLAEKWSASNVSGTGSTLTIAAGGRHSSNCLRWITGTGATVAGGLNYASGTNPTIIFGFAVNVSASIVTTNDTVIAAIKNGAGADHITFAVTSSMTIIAQRSTTILGTTIGTLPIGAYAYVEIKVLIDNAIGTIEIRINGATVLNLSGLDTMGTSTSSFIVSIGQYTSVTSTNITPGRTFDFDDVYVCDAAGSAPWNDFLGDVRVDVCNSTAEGASSGWTPSAGSDNTLNIDDAAPDDDTTYNSAGSVVTDTFVVQNAPVVGATIYGIQHCMSMRKTDAGTCTIAPVVRHSSVDNVGTGINPGTTYSYGLAVNQTNPGTSAAWTEADFNAAEFGYKRTV